MKWSGTRPCACPTKAFPPSWPVSTKKRRSGDPLRGGKETGMNGNSVTLVGNIVDDPELRFTPGGQAMAKFRIAVSRRWQDRASGEWQEESSFFGCTCWRE